MYGRRGDRVVSLHSHSLPCLSVSDLGKIQLFKTMRLNG